MPALPAPLGNYDKATIALHWSIAALIAVNLVLGWIFRDFGTDVRRAILMQHRAIGLTVLLLTIGRFSWRFFGVRLALPSYLTTSERRLALGVRYAIYTLTLIVPLTGWIMASARLPAAGIPWWGLTFPRFPLPSMIETDIDKLKNTMAPIHRWLSWALVTAVALHSAAVVKHAVLDRDNLVRRMLPWRSD